MTTDTRGQVRFAAATLILVVSCFSTVGAQTEALQQARQAKSQSAAKPKAAAAMKLLFLGKVEIRSEPAIEGVDLIKTGESSEKVFCKVGNCKPSYARQHHSLRDIRVLLPTSRFWRLEYP